MHEASSPLQKTEQETDATCVLCKVGGPVLTQCLLWEVPGGGHQSMCLQSENM